MFVCQLLEEDNITLLLFIPMYSILYLHPKRIFVFVGGDDSTIHPPKYSSAGTNIAVFVKS